MNNLRGISFGVDESVGTTISGDTINKLTMRNNTGFDIVYENKLLVERIRRILMTSKTERVNNPEFGSSLEMYIFNRGSILKQHVQANLKNVIETYEPRVTVNSCDIICDDTKHEAHITISCKRKDTLEDITFEEFIAI